MTILIDADGCPVVDLTLQIEKQFDVAALFSSAPSSRKKGTSLS